MYRITKTEDGAVLGMTEAPNYIRKSENGCFILCPEPEASGIAFAGTPYHLLGREEMEGAETVSLEEVDAGGELTAAQEEIADLRTSLAATDESTLELYEALLGQEAETAKQDEAIIEIYETIGGEVK